MAFLFFVLFFLSIIGLIIGLIKPTRVKMKSRKQVSWIFGGGIVLFLILQTITTPQNQSTVATNPVSVSATGTHTASTSTAASQVPLTDQQKITNVVQSLIQQSSTEFPSIKSVEVVDSDGTIPNTDGMKFVAVHIEAGTFWNDSSTITETGQLTSKILQQVFPLNPKFYDIQVWYYGQLTDEYGNKSDGLMIDYDMERDLYGKVNWAGFSDNQNDIHLCAFLREQTAMDDGNNVNDTCGVMLASLKKAESSIETSNPQFSDIPQSN
jgi:hypothetical protein